MFSDWRYDNWHVRTVYGSNEAKGILHFLNRGVKKEETCIKYVKDQSNVYSQREKRPVAIRIQYKCWVFNEEAATAL